MSGVYSMTGGPTYRGATSADLFQSAMDEPLSLFSTLGQSAKTGVLESFGLGTAIKKFTTPEEAPTVPGITANQPGDRDFLNSRWEKPEELAARRESMGALSEDQYKASASFRKDIPYDPGMTEARAAALAASDDAKKAREYFTSKRPFAAFIGSLGGQAFDPINYVPIAGPAVKAAAVGRFGRIGGEALTAAADAASNTALFGIGTAGERAKYGDDVSWQSTVSQIATAALIGSAFGALSGAVGKRVDARRVSEAEQRLATLKTTQEARIALNEGIDALVRGEDIRLSPNSTDPMARVAGEVEGLSKAYDEVKANPTGAVRDPLVAITPDDIEGTLVARGAFQRVNEAEFSKRGWGLVKIIWRHGEMGSEAPEFQVRKDDVTALPSVVREYEPSSVSNDGAQREWRVERDGRTIVYADSAFDGDRHTVTAYVQKPDAPGADVPLSQKRKPVATGSPDEPLKPVGDTALEALPSPERGQSLPAGRNIAQRPAIDNTTARPDPQPEGIQQAEAAVAKPEDAKALAAQYHVDPQTGAFPEEAEVVQLAAEGRLTEEDAATLAAAHADYETGAAYAEALKSVAGCLL